MLPGEGRSVWLGYRWMGSLGALWMKSFPWSNYMNKKKLAKPHSVKTPEFVNITGTQNGHENVNTEEEMEIERKRKIESGFVHGTLAPY